MVLDSFVVVEEIIQIVVVVERINVAKLGSAVRIDKSFFVWRAQRKPGSYVDHGPQT